MQCFLLLGISNSSVISIRVKPPKPTATATAKWQRDPAVTVSRLSRLPVSRHERLEQCACWSPWRFASRHIAFSAAGLQAKRQNPSCVKPVKLLEHGASQLQCVPTLDVVHPGG